MTALGSHEHFQCDQCKTVQRVRTEDLVRGSMETPHVKLFDQHPTDGPLRPPNWAVLQIWTGGDRLSGVTHLCQSCRNALDTHFFGPNGCDGPKVTVLKNLLERIRLWFGGDQRGWSDDDLVAEIERMLGLNPADEVDG